MNLRLHHVISDITGQTGLAIVDALLAGQRDPQQLAKLRNERIKASEEIIATSLVGDYSHEHLSTLRQSLAAYPSYQKLIDDCDSEIRQQLAKFDSIGSPQPPAASKSEAPKPSSRKLSDDGPLKAELN
jgi:hypothetical protein